MQNPTTPVLKDLVLIGGGHSHVAVLRRFAMRPLAGVRLTLICPEAYTPYSGMLPGLIAGHYDFDEAHIDLMRLCRFARARFIRAAVTGLDLENQKAVCAGRPPLPYDLLSINSGSTPDPAGVPGAEGRVIPVKPVSDFLARWEVLKRQVLERPGLRIGIIGGGAGGVEMALSAQFALGALRADRGAGAPSLHLVTSGPEILASHNARVRAAFDRILAARSIDLHTGFEVERVTDTGVEAGGRRLDLDVILWITGAGAPAWIRESGLATDEAGFVAVDRYLRSPSHPNVFAVGDAATMLHAPRPKSGVFAVRQGGPLADNLRHAAQQRPLRAYRPQKAFLGLISTGDKTAIASRGPWFAKGAWVWRAKDWIDRRFMARYNDLPDMQGEKLDSRESLPLPPEAQAALGDLAMRCGGCGAKVGARTLSDALRDLAPLPAPDILLGLDAPDDAALLLPPAGKALVQTVDSFRAMIDDPYLFGRIAANHSLGDIYAMGGEPRWALALATLPAGLAGKTGATLSQMMTGALEVLNEAGCSLVGGHTGEALELSLGFSVTGLIDPDRALRKAGAAPGEVLILTKPLGTGTIFAADMRAKAEARWVEAAIALALQSNREASRILHAHGATAATDVTGFGLAGHLFEMLQASGVHAEIDLEAVPALAGALATLAAGLVSSLQADNRQREETIAGAPSHSDDPRFALLFDPQTAGGLLASLPAAKAAACLQALHESGYADASLIGRAVASPAEPKRIRIV